MAELPQIISTGGIDTPPPAAVPESHVGSAIADAGDKLGVVYENALREKQVGQMSNAIGDFLLKRDDIANKLSSVRDPDAYLTSYKAQAQDAYSQALNQVAPGPMQNHLAGQLKIHMAEGEMNATNRSIELAVKQGQDNISQALRKWSPIAATAADPRDRDMATVNAHGLIYGNKYTTPEEKDATWLSWQHDTALHGLQNRVVQNDPTVALELQSPDFQKKNPLILPEERERMMTQVISQSEYADRANTAALRAQRADAQTQINQLAAQGKPLDAALETYGAHFGNEDGYYRFMAGHPYEQSSPGLVGDFGAAIKTATSPADINVVLDHALAARASGTVSRGDYAQIRFDAETGLNAMKGANKAAELTGKVDLHDALIPPASPIETMMRKLAPKVTKSDIDEDYEAALARHKGDVNAAKKDVMDKYRTILGGSTAGGFGALSEGATPVSAGPAAK